MLFWICPECGRECSPAIRECPACAETPAASVVSQAGVVQQQTGSGQAILALARTFEATPTKLLPAPVALVESPANNGHSDLTAPERVPVAEGIDSLVRPLVESVEAAPLVETKAAAETPFEQPAAIQPAITPEPAEVVAEAQPIAEPIAASAEPLSVPAESPQPEIDPGAVTEALTIQAEVVLAAVSACLEAERSEIRAVVTSFQQQPKAAMLPAPREIVAAPAPPAVEWLRTPRPAIAPSRPQDSPAPMITGPQASALAGPSLPAELRNLTEKLSNGLKPRRKPISFPAWIVSVLMATALFLGAGALWQHLASTGDVKTAAPEAQVNSAVPAATPRPNVQNPLARVIEITGLRVVNGWNRKPQLQYIIVNHTPREFSKLPIQIVVKSSDSPSAAALFTVSAVIPTLAAYQSKEMRTDIDPALRIASLQEWQVLRAEAQPAER